MLYMICLSDLLIFGLRFCLWIQWIRYRVTRESAFVGKFAFSPFILLGWLTYIKTKRMLYGEGVLPIMADTGRLRLKGVPFLGFKTGIWNDTDFSSWSVWKSRKFCHLGLEKDPKGWNDRRILWLWKSRENILVWGSFISYRKCICNS